MPDHTQPHHFHSLKEGDMRKDPVDLLVDEVDGSTVTQRKAAEAQRRRDFRDLERWYRAAQVVDLLARDAYPLPLMVMNWVHVDRFAEAAEVPSAWLRRHLKNDRANMNDEYVNWMCLERLVDFKWQEYGCLVNNHVAKLRPSPYLDGQPEQPSLLLDA